MKIGLFNFSGRYSPGNCSKIINYIDNKCKKKGVITSHLNITNLNIQPCCRCNYECFTSTCPLNDDLETAYKFIIENDIVVFVLPVYSSAPPATYFAWRERSQAFFSIGEFYELYNNVQKAYIIIGNADAGGENVIRIIEEYDDSQKAKFLLLQNHKYGLNSISGKLIEVDEVTKNIDTLINKLTIEKG